MGEWPFFDIMAFGEHELPSKPNAEVRDQNMVSKESHQPSVAPATLSLPLQTSKHLYPSRSVHMLQGSPKLFVHAVTGSQPFLLWKDESGT